MSKESIISKIDKLFKLAGNNPSQAESEAAMLKAQELMLKHGLEGKDIEVKIKELSAEEMVIDQKNKMTKWFESALTRIVAKNFRCSSFTRKRQAYIPGTTKITTDKVNIIVGLPSDVEVAHMVTAQAINHLNENVKLYMKLWKIHFPATITCDRKNGEPIKNDFISGYIEGLESKFQEQVKDMKFELMIVLPDAVVKHCNGLNLRRSRGTSVSTSGLDGAKDAGRDVGRSFNAGTSRRIS